MRVMPGRLLTFAGPLVATAGLVVLPATASAAFAPAPTPSPPPPLQTVQITGAGLASPIVLRSDRDSARQSALRDEVVFIAHQPGQTEALPPDKLGPKFTIVLATDNKPTDQFDLYPLAAGGPRLHRPADQPDKRQVGEGWFYGRVSLPTTMQAAGVALQGFPEEAGGGGGGDTTQATEAPDVGDMLGDWRNFMGLNMAVIIVVAAGVFALAYVLRRQV